MKNICSLNNIVITATFTFLFICREIFAQDYLMSIDNCLKLNDQTIEFEIIIKSNSSSFLLTSYQCVFNFNTEIIGNGNITFSYVSNSTQLYNYPAFGIGVNNGDNQTELTFASMAGSDSITTFTKRVGTFRLNNSIPFSGNEFSIFWDFDGSVNTILTGENFINITNSNYHNNLNVFWDTIPPTLDIISVVDSVSLLLTFSENLDSTNISSTSNYSISNGISVLNASLLSPGNSVFLNTTAHLLGQSYLISAANIRDLAGNMISSQGNSLNYTFGELLSLKLKIFLQGAFTDGIMRTTLNQMNLCPLNQPYNIPPWNYFGSETVTTIPNDVVDWVLIELRADTSSLTIITRKAAFITRNGSITNLDGGDLTFIGLPRDYYVVVFHRNHLGIMSSNKLSLSRDTVTYDFTISQNSAYGTISLADLGNGLYGMYAGDADGNGIINNVDLNSSWKKQNGLVGYRTADFDLNGGVNIYDKNIYWIVNKGKTSNIPNE